MTLIEEERKERRRLAEHRSYLKNKEQRRIKNQIWRRKNPEKAKAIRDVWRAKRKEHLAAYNIDYDRRHPGRHRRWRAMAKERRERLAAACERTPEESRVSALNADKLFALASKHVSSSLPPWKRDDIIADMVIAMLEGRLAAEDITKKAKEYVSDYNRRFNDFMAVEFDDRWMQTPD